MADDRAETMGKLHRAIEHRIDVLTARAFRAETERDAALAALRALWHDEQDPARLDRMTLVLEPLGITPLDLVEGAGA